MHTLSYKGMGVFSPLPAANRATPLWIAARHLESASLLVFPSESTGRCIVEIQSSSPAALARFQRNPGDFDLVISDVAMPEMTGDRLAAAVKRIRPDIPVILCTGFSERMDEERVKRLGVDGFVLKPVLKKDIAELIRKVVRKDRPADASERTG